MAEKLHNQIVFLEARLRSLEALVQAEQEMESQIKAELEQAEEEEEEEEEEDGEKFKACKEEAGVSECEDALECEGDFEVIRIMRMREREVEDVKEIVEMDTDDDTCAVRDALDMHQRACDEKVIPFIIHALSLCYCQCIPLSESLLSLSSLSEMLLT